MNALDDAAVRPYCESLPRELERADMDFNAIYLRERSDQRR
jgi:hypothetical protein